MIAFVVPLTPVPKGRPRVYNGRAVTPTKTRKYEDQFAMFAAQHAPPAPFERPIAIDLTFYLPRPKRLMRKKDPAGAVPCDRRPDIDNLSKSALDAMARWWRDDAQITRMTTEKLYAEKDGMPRIVVAVEVIDA